MVRGVLGGGRLQLTLALIKPHALQNPVALGYIRAALQRRFLLLRSLRMRLDRARAQQLYEEHRGKFFYNRLLTFMTSGCVDVHIMANVNAIDQWRRMMGPTKVYKAQFEQPNSLRGLFGLSDTRNVAHGSDSIHSAEREIKFFFPDFSFDDFYNNMEQKFRKGLFEFDQQNFQHKVKR